MASGKKQKKMSGSRLLCLAAFFVLWMIAIGWRLTVLQVSQHDKYFARAEEQRTDTIKVSPLSGEIVDRKGRVLASSNYVESAFAYTKDVNEPQKFAHTLAPLLGVNAGDLQQRLEGAKNRYLWLKRKMEGDVPGTVRNLLDKNDLSGVHFVREPHRFYPHGKLASHVLGYVDIDEKGLAGIELKYNDLLRGKPGYEIFKTDSLNRQLSLEENPPVNGLRLETTIDAALQHHVESIIDNARKETKAKSITAIVLDPQTGEILALANAPDFNLNVRPTGGDKEAEDRVRRNRAITDVYEPGSIFKIVTYSGVIEEGLAKPGDKVDCQGGSITLHGRTIRDSHAGTGVVTVAEALAKSSNVGAIKMGQKLGEKRLFDYLTRFGFGNKTGIDLPGEVSGLVNPLARWHGTSFASVSMGHEVGVTAVQAITAMATIASGGIRPQPHIVRRAISEDGRTIYEAKPEAARVISTQTAGTMAGMLESVVDNGTGRRGRLAGFRVAGKTGTAQKVKPGGGYSNTAFIASFAGFFPIENPRFAIIVVVDEPVGAHQGGQVAAPAFAAIAEAAINLYMLPPEGETTAQPEQNTRTSRAESAKTPEVAATGDSTAAKNLQPATKPEKQEQKKTEPVRTAPTPKQSEAKKQEVIVSRNIPAVSPEQNRSSAAGSGIMPDLHGRSLRAVTQACASLGLKVKVSGSGAVVRQSPAPGTQVKAGGICSVEFH